MIIKHLIVPFEIKAIHETGEFEGYGSTFGNIDFGDDIIQRGAFLDTLAEWKAKGELPLMPWLHDMRMLVGDWLSMEEDEKGLFVKGALWLGDKEIPDSKRVHNLLTGTGPKEMSIGFEVIESEHKEIENDGVKKLVRIILKVKLFELSIVPFGMNPEALVTGVKSLLGNNGALVDMKSFERVLRDAGLSPNQAKTVVAKGYKALLRDVEESANAGGGRDDADSLRELLKSMKKTTNLILGQ